MRSSRPSSSSLLGLANEPAFGENQPHKSVKPGLQPHFSPALYSNARSYFRIGKLLGDDMVDLLTP